MGLDYFNTHDEAAASAMILYNKMIQSGYINPEKIHSAEDTKIRAHQGFNGGWAVEILHVRNGWIKAFYAVADENYNLKEDVLDAAWPERSRLARKILAANPSAILSVAPDGTLMWQVGSQPAPDIVKGGIQPATGGNPTPGSVYPAESWLVGGKIPTYLSSPAVVQFSMVDRCDAEIDRLAREFNWQTPTTPLITRSELDSIVDLIKVDFAGGTTNTIDASEFQKLRIKTSFTAWGSFLGAAISGDIITLVSALAISIYSQIDLNVKEQNSFRKLTNDEMVLIFQYVVYGVYLKKLDVYNKIAPKKVVANVKGQIDATYIIQPEEPPKEKSGDANKPLDTEKVKYLSTVEKSAGATPPTEAPKSIYDGIIPVVGVIGISLLL